MTILKITSDIERHQDTNTNNDNAFKEASFNIDLVTGAFDDKIIDSFELIKTPYNPSKGDKIYFLPGVSVPRVKFKNVCVEYGIKTIRDIDQANVIFASKKSLIDMSTYDWKYQCKTKSFKDLIAKYESNIDGHDLEKIKSALEFYDNEFIAVDYNLNDWIKKSDLNNDSLNYSNKLHIIKEEYVDIFNSLKNKQIFDESCVINVLNGEDATEIDEVMYNHLAEMFESSDTDNHVLAMEIMANSKYVESLIYIEMLFYKYSRIISEKHTKNHVNFKSLISYLGKDKTYLDTNIDDIAKSLIDKDLFTEDNINIIMNHCSDVVKRGGGTKCFSVKTVTLHSDYAHCLNKNYEYEVQADYVATIDEAVVEEIIPEVKLEEVIPNIVEEIPESEFATKDNFEKASEEETPHMLYEVDNEDIEVLLTLEEEEVEEEEITLEIEANNNQIETNDTTDFEWF